MRKPTNKRAQVIPVQKCWLSTKEACEYLGVSRDTLRVIRDTGQITFSRVGQKLTWYSLDSIDKLIKRGIVINAG